MSDESNILKKIWLSLGKHTTLFRLNTGKGWVGKGRAIRNTDGSVTLPYAQPISIGFAYANTQPVSGASDLVGWTSLEITPSMIGRKIAIFTSIECKNSKGGKKSDPQYQWINNLIRDGGIAGFAKSEEEALAIVRQYNI